MFQNLLAEVGQKNKQENGTKWLRMFLATGKLAFFIKVRMGPGPTFAVGIEIPVISPVSTVRAVQIGAPPWRSMRPVDEQEVRQVCSDRHETCTLIFQLFEIYNLVH